jgi:hypothetical protein
LLSKNDQKIIDDIAGYGWHLISVVEDETSPPFTYSVGMMKTLDHPEILMIGLPHETMRTIINAMGDDIRAGRRFTTTGLYEGYLVGYACKCGPIASRHHPQYLGYAMWHRRHVGQPGTLSAIQCLWPDKQGRFPDESDCHPYISHRQPLLTH